ncbi:MAG: hypothetical protein ABIP90_07640 [Vicinamibacterales bacterium]
MTRRVLLTMAMAALAIASSACGKDNVSPAPPAVATSATPTATSVNLVSLADLRACVPDFRGWTRGEMVAQEGSAPQRSTQVVVTFTRGTERLEMEIADTGGAPRAIESLEQIAGSTTNRTVGNGYFKGTTVSGFPAVEAWNTVEKVGELSVLIRRRYIIHVAGSGMAGAASMRALAEAVDSSRLR